MPENIKTISIFGGSGKTGQVFIQQTIARGINIKTLARNPENLRQMFPSISVNGGSLQSPADVESVLSGSDAVICLFGPRPPYSDIFCERATQTIISAMKKNHMTRLICLTGGMIGDYPENRTKLFQLMSGAYRKNHPQNGNDREEQERVVINSGLHWTILKPPRLSNRQRSRNISFGLTIKLGIMSSISRKDLCRFIIHMLSSNEFNKRIIFLKN